MSNTNLARYERFTDRLVRIIQAVGVLGIAAFIVAWVAIT